MRICVSLVLPNILFYTAYSDFFKCIDTLTVLDDQDNSVRVLKGKVQVRLMIKQN